MSYTTLQARMLANAAARNPNRVHIFPQAAANAAGHATAPVNVHVNVAVAAPSTTSQPAGGPLDDTLLGGGGAPFLRGGSDSLEETSASLGEDAPELAWEHAWQVVAPAVAPPEARSGAGAVVHEDTLYLFGGYGADVRLNDVWAFDLDAREWTEVPCEGERPAPRENNGVVLMGHRLFVFGGYSGTQWLADLHELDLTRRTWRTIEPRSEVRPTPRFGYASAAYESAARSELLFFGGYDGVAWLNDLVVFDLHSWEWSSRRQSGTVPSARSCPSWARRGDQLYVFGGFDGASRMNDFHCLDLATLTWSSVPHVQGQVPSGRYLHASVVHNDHFYVYGGFDGTGRLEDLHAYNFLTKGWTRLPTPSPPSGRSSVVAAVHHDALWVFGGYDGDALLDDMYKLSLSTSVDPPGTLMNDLFSLVDNAKFGDVRFELDSGEFVWGVAGLIASRSEYFYNLLYGEMRDSKAREPIVRVRGVEKPVLLLLLQYLHTDRLFPCAVEEAVALAVLAQRYVVDRLQRLCTEYVRRRLTTGNVLEILLAANRHNVSDLRRLCIVYVVAHLDVLKRTPEFAGLKQDPDLLLEIILAASTTSSPQPSSRKDPIPREDSQGSDHSREASQDAIRRRTNAFANYRR